MSKVEKQLTDVVDVLGDAFEKDARKNYLDNFADELSSLSFDKFSNWELFQYQTKEPIEQHIKVWHARKYPFLGGDTLEIIEWFFMNFDMIDHNIEKLVDLGRGCSVDKSHFIMRSFIDYLISGVAPEYAERGNENHKYWEPDFGKAEDWFEFIESLRSLYYGMPERYLKSYGNLLSMREIVVAALNADQKIMQDFLPTYKEILANQEGVMESSMFKQMSNSYTFGMVLGTLLPAIKDGSWTEELIVKTIEEVYEKHFNY